MNEHQASLSMIFALIAGPVLAQPCADFFPEPSAMESVEPSSLAFDNHSHYAFNVLWANYDGGYTDMGLVQPDETLPVNAKTFHFFYVEAYLPDETFCIGPFGAEDAEGCNVRITAENGLNWETYNCISGL